MFAVGNVIRSATRRSSGDPLNILTICNNNEKYIALLCATGHNFFLLKRDPFNWKAPIENKPSNLQVIDQNWPSSYFDMILCNDRLDQYHFAAELSQSFHLPIVLIDHCSSHVIKPECAFGTVSVDSPEALIRNCAANVCTSEYANKSWPGSNLRLTIPIGIDTDKFVIPHVPILDEAFGENLTPTRIVFDNNTQPQVGDSIFSSFTKNSHTVIPTDTDIGEKERVYQQGDYFISPQNHVTVKMLEAMACGNIPICFSTPDIDAFIQHGVDGFVLNEPSEVPDLIGKLDSLAPEERAGISQKARDKVVATQSTPEEFVSKWNGIFSYMRSQYYNIEGVV